MSAYFYELLLRKTTQKYTENPMTQKVHTDGSIDDTYIIVKNVVDKVSELITHPYDYFKKYIIKKNENDENENDEDENENENEHEDEEITVVTISYDTIYKAEQTEQTEPSEDNNVDALVKTASAAYTFVVTTYNDVVT